MTLKRRFETLIIKNPKLARIALAELGYVRPEETRTYTSDREMGVKNGIKAGMNEALAIMKACRREGLDLQQAEKMIDEGMDLKAAMETIASLSAWNDALDKFTGKLGNGKHSLIMECEKKAKSTESIN